jgi:hypothetical protein
MIHSFGGIYDIFTTTFEEPKGAPLISLFSCGGIYTLNGAQTFLTPSARTGASAFFIAD